MCTYNEGLRLLQNICEDYDMNAVADLRGLQMTIKLTNQFGGVIIYTVTDTGRLMMEFQSMGAISLTPIKRLIGAVEAYIEGAMLEYHAAMVCTGEPPQAVQYPESRVEEIWR